MFLACRLFAQRHFAALICAAALTLKLLVPTGYMIDSSRGRMTVAICSGTGPAMMTRAIPGMDHSIPDPGKKDHDKAEMPCAFAGLSAPMTGATDPIQLIALIAFVMALGLVAAILPAPARPGHLRPPLRGPPAYL